MKYILILCILLSSCSTPTIYVTNNEKPWLNCKVYKPNNL